MENFNYSKFNTINLDDSFFTSLKNDYSEFASWFERKSEEDESAYIQTIDGKIEGFLYLKIEVGPIKDVNPSIECLKAVKIGTMKIIPHGTRLGERFIKKSLDFAIENNATLIYVTVFEKHSSLIKLYEKYGFKKFASKTTSNGVEKVLLRDLSKDNNDFLLNYPLIKKESNAYLMSIYPKFHTKLFPDSILKSENFNVVKDISHTNSIEKIYICKMNGVSNLKPGDLIVIYRTSDIDGQARFRAVVTSVCTVKSIKSTKSFRTYIEFKEYCKNYSIFSDSELYGLYHSRDEYFTIQMIYNIAFEKRLTRGHLLDTIGINSKYWGFFKLSKNEFEDILIDANVKNDYII